MSSNNKNYRTMNEQTRAMVKAYEKELMKATMDWEADKNRLHNARINGGERRRVVDPRSGRKGRLTWKPGAKVSDLVELVEKLEAKMEVVKTNRKKYLLEKDLI